MGEVSYYVPEFTDEEKKALEGDEATPEEPEKPEEETKEPEQKEEQEPEKKLETEQKEETSEPEKKTDAEKAEAKGLRVEGDYIIDSDGEKIPVKRWKEVYRERKETERKLNLLLELGQEEYFKRYPDERPASYQPKKEPAPPPVQPVPLDQLGSMVVKGGKYDGMTLNEVYSIDPAVARVMQDNYIASVSQHIAAVRKTAQDAQKQKAVESEVERFIRVRALEYFDKGTTELSEQEQNQIAESLNAAADLLSKSDGELTLEEAYVKVRKAEKKRKEEEAKQALEQANKKPVGSIGTGNVSGQDTGFAAFETMSDSQMTRALDKMSSAEYRKFIKEAPQSLRKKHPELPWF